MAFAIVRHQEGKTAVSFLTNFTRAISLHLWNTSRCAIGVVLLCVSSLVPPSLYAQRNTAWPDRLANPVPQYVSVDSISPAAERAMGAEGWKSPSRAFLYSFLGTAIPVGVGGATALGNNELSAGALVAIGGAVLGPSLGHFYAQRKGRAIRGIVARGAAAGIMAATLSSSDEGGNEGLAALFVGASLVGVTFFVADIAGAAHSARAHNQKLAGRARICVSPLVRPIAGAPGIGLRVAY